MSMRLRDWDRNLKVRLAGESVVNITFWMFFPFLSIYFTEAFGKSTAGMLLILSQVFSCAANLLGGYYADKYGRKKMMVLSAFVQGAAFTVFAVSSSSWFDSPLLGFVCFTVVSMFGAVYWPASQAMIADVVGEKDRSDVFAEYRFPLLLMAGVLNLVLGLVLQYMVKETAPVQRKEESIQNKNWFSVLGNQLKDYRVIMNDRVFLLFIIAGVLIGQTFMQLDLLFPVYINEVVTNQPLLRFGNWSYVVENTQAFGLVLAENGLLVAIFTIVVTRWMSKYKERNVFIISSFTYAVSVLLFSQTSWIWGLLFAMLVFTLAELMTAGIQQGFISELAPADKRGKYFAAASLRYTFSKVLAPVSIPMSVWFGYTWTFIIISLLACLSGILYYRMFHKFEKRKALETAPKW